MEKTHLVKETPPEKINITNYFVQTIPMNHLGRESCSAMASMIPVFHLHCTNMEFSIFIFSGGCVVQMDEHFRLVDPCQKVNYSLIPLLKVF